MKHLKVFSLTFFSQNNSLFFLKNKQDFFSDSRCIVIEGNLVLRTLCTSFPSNFRGIAFWMAKLNAGLCLPEQRNKKIKYFIP